MKTYLSGHGAYRLKYHMVFVCKYRRKVLNPGIETTLRRLLPSLLRSMPGCAIEEIGFDEDHMHMVMVIPPKYSISDVVGRLKSQSTKYLRSKFKYLAKVYWKERVFWSPGYFVSSVGLDEKTIKNYVKYQGAKDSNQLELKF